ncbi:pantoate--beta-alanine ligase [Plasmopara halstedii]|uniref:Pantoate--beta-alanine ligase n=1 Tax=Plasmopara halstedii TaxID=4781 RepID=A0A0P1A5V9_PLAHL|nr:pantoate--beta-alanine ligase [Plasmopara halstedii]CEG35920.1 pantoate--beta-alanine ligase [Plasmopara halstedii]|eukprot:XP_024572289.1 pantoate--beta-alanine ligase [Plasmopara halstedii]
MFRPLLARPAFALANRSFSSISANQLQILESIKTFRKARHAIPRDATLGFVPTMGGLHDGHMALVEHARNSCDFIAASIFVNPTQFGPSEDYSKYPRTFEKDIALLTKLGVDFVFLPSADEMYMPHHCCYVVPSGFDDLVEGKCRQGHFRGVATIVTKLFNIVQPTHAFFGQKDAAQVVLIKRLVSDLNMSVKINVVPIVREADGLALSTRNQYLSPVERKAASVLYRGLVRAQHLFQKAKEEGKETIETKALYTVVYKELESEPLVTTIDYVSVGSKQTMREMSIVDTTEGAIVSVAVKIGNCRLIDNIVL